MWCNGSTLARNAKDVGSSPALGTVFPIFVTPRQDYERILLYAEKAALDSLCVPIIGG